MSPAPAAVIPDRPYPGIEAFSYADHAVFFWDGKSKAVAELIEKAEAKGIPVEVVRFTSRGAA